MLDVWAGGALGGALSALNNNSLIVDRSAQFLVVRTLSNVFYLKISGE